MLVLKTKRTEIEPEWIPEVFTPLERRWNLKSKSKFITGKISHVI